MCINEGDLVKMICKTTGFFITGIYVRKGELGHVIIADDIVQFFYFDDWEVERVE